MRSLLRILYRRFVEHLYQSIPRCGAKGYSEHAGDVHFHGPCICTLVAGHVQPKLHTCEVCQSDFREDKRAAPHGG